MTLKRPGKRKAKPKRQGRQKAPAGAPATKRGNQSSRGEDSAATPSRRPQNTQSVSSSALWLYGRHAVAAALSNPDREVIRVFATRNGSAWLAAHVVGKALSTPIVEARPEEIDHLLHQGAVHQGIAAEVKALPLRDLDDICANPTPATSLVVLDQVTDPQNIGAIFRAAAAFGASAIIVQDRRTPPLTGALAKAAAGAVETVPCIPVVNIARTLETLAEYGYDTVGLAGEAIVPMQAIDTNRPMALVLGAEGAGLRRLVSEKCTQLVRIPIAPGMESLNVATAAAIGLYERSRNRN